MFDTQFLYKGCYNKMKGSFRMKKRKPVYYVSHYREYPIYEPAEGGYYYVGAELAEYSEFRTLRKARKFLEKISTEYGYNVICKNKSVKESKHIGNGAFIKIETVKGKNEKHYEPYQ